MSTGAEGTGRARWGVGGLRPMDHRPQLQKLVRDTRGLSTVEYIIILCLIAVVGFAVWKQFGQTVEEKTRAASTVMGDLPESSE